MSAVLQIFMPSAVASRSDCDRGCQLLRDRNHLLALKRSFADSKAVVMTR
jgi:hypothetical protein